MIFKIQLNAGFIDEVVVLVKRHPTNIEQAKL